MIFKPREGKVMKKAIIAITLGLLLVGVTAYAAGDLIVNGNVGIGTSTPSTKLDVETDGLGLRVGIQQTAVASVLAGNYSLDIDGPTRVYGSVGFSSILRYLGTSSPLPAARGAIMQFQFRSPSAGSSTFSFIRGLDLEIRNMDDNVRDFTGNEITMFRTGGSYTGTGGIITVTDLTGASIEDIGAPSGRLNATNQYGIKIEQQTRATNNYGIALIGDGAGSDVVFGPSKNVRIYSQSGRLWAQDSAFNKTVLSPHDPETGEWVYYSKNVKTGKVVKVNMEKLVKAVEKLTGEKFMIETTEDIE